MEIKNNFISIEQVTNKYLKDNKKENVQSESKTSFKDIFLQQSKENSQKIKFSKHF